VASYKRVKTGWRAFVNQKGLRKSRTFDTKKEAKEWAARKEGENKKGKPAEKLGTVIDRYVREIVPQHKGAKWERMRLARLKEALGEHTLDVLAKGDQLAAWRNERLKEVSAGSVRREMNLLNQVFNTAVDEWRLYSKNPLRGIKKPPAPPPRTRTLSPEEVDTMLEALGFNGWLVSTHQHQVALALLIALETAMRLNEILQIPVAHSGKAFRVLGKNGEYRSVPLSKKLDVLALAKMVGHRDPRSLMIYYRESMEDLADTL